MTILSLSLHLSLFSAEDAQEMVEKMLGNNLITKQTTEEGIPCSKVLNLFRCYLWYIHNICNSRTLAADGRAYVHSKRAVFEYYAGPGNFRSGDCGKYGRRDGD